MKSNKVYDLMAWIVMYLWVVNPSTPSTWEGAFGVLAACLVVSCKTFQALVGIYEVTNDSSGDD